MKGLPPSAGVPWFGPQLLLLNRWSGGVGFKIIPRSNGHFMESSHSRRSEVTAKGSAAGEESVEARTGAASMSFLVFTIGPWRLAVDLERVERTIPIMEAVPLPGAPQAIAGAIRLNDGMVPVADLRGLLGLSLKKVQGDDALILLSTAVRRLAFWVDGVEGVKSFPADRLLQARPLLGDNRYISRMASGKEGVILIHDPEALLSAKEEAALAEAVKKLQEQED